MKLIECPRDAMQGIHEIIPTETKIDYLNLLLKIGFDTLDFGSFVNPKAIPQMADTHQVVEALDMDGTKTKLLSIIANERGAKEASQYEQISYLGFPFSVSQMFQQNNTNATQEQAIERIKAIQDIALATNKEMVVYLSMGFGNPYGEDWSTEIVEQWVDKLAEIEIPILALSDTVGVAEPEPITELFKEIIPKYKAIEFGAHFHSKPGEWQEKIEAALKGGCTRFDSTIKGIGGCPLAKDDLVGNIATEKMLMYMGECNMDFDHIEQEFLLEAIQKANRVFPEVLV